MQTSTQTFVDEIFHNYFILSKLDLKIDDKIESKQKLLEMLSAILDNTERQRHFLYGSLKVDFEIFKSGSGQLDLKLYDNE
jgi:hypothetical protein